MPLMPIYYTSLNLNPRRSMKSSKKNRQANLNHEEWLKSRGLHSSQLLSKKSEDKTPAKFDIPLREVPYNSSHNITGKTNKAETKVYTGTLIKGIATMHKSNAVPIINDEQAIEISKMRRG